MNTITGKCDKCTYQGLLYAVKVTYKNGTTKTLRLCYLHRKKLRDKIRHAIGITREEQFDALERQIAKDARIA